MMAGKLYFNRALKLYCFLLLIFTCSLAIAQSSSYNIYLKYGTLSPAHNASDWIANAQQKSSAAPRQVLIQFHSLPAAAEKEMLRGNGIHLLDYIPDNTYVAIIPGLLSAEVVRQAKIRSIIEMKPEWKTHAGLMAQAKNAKGKTTIKIAFHKTVAEEEITSFVAAAGGHIIKSSLKQFGIYSIGIPFSALSKLAAWYGTSYIEPETEDMPLNSEAKAAVRGNILAAPVHAQGLGLTGDGVTVGVGDNVSGNFHIDLKDRIINYNPQAYTNHGVHINGIVGGAGIVDPHGEGMAPGAQLINHFYSEVLEQTPAMVAAHDMTITNNSYAAAVGDCRFAGVYDLNSRLVDDLALRYPNVIHVFAAGNDGKLNCQPYPAGFGTITGGYQPAKNNIVVTSTDKKFVNAIDGSRGPVRDGRLKPEITAVGVDVFSTTRTDAYLVAGGTSMASPSVAGGLALLTERYRQLFGAGNPRADLMKAIILNGATDIGNPGPDYRFGFGFMNLNRSQIILQNNWFGVNSIGQADEQNINLEVPAGTGSLKLMLCWQDAMASPTAAKQLVNDLDMVLLGPGGKVYKPLVLDPTPGNILQNATEGEDRLNNTEQIVVEDVPPGSYTLVVKGHAVPGGSQDYAYCYDLLPDVRAITYPQEGAAVAAGERLIIYWDEPNRSNAKHTLEYAIDGGNWIKITDEALADSGYYVWNVPADINSAACRLRLAGSTESSRFTINRQPIVKLSTAQCPGYFNISWDSIPNATGYELLKKSGPAMMPVDTVTARAYSFSGLALDSFYFVAVRPLFNDRPGYRSLAVKRMPNTGDCTGPESDGDLMIQAIVSPEGGRKLTSTELTAADTLSLLLRNLDNIHHNYYLLSYSINDGPWVSRLYNTPIPPNSTWRIDIPGIDLSATGQYKIEAAIQNYLMPDPEQKNDTIVRVLRHLENNPVDLATAFTDDFEAMVPIHTLTDSFGLSPNGHWDYFNLSDTGRLRTYVNPSITINGNRSISLDAIQFTAAGSGNQFRGTFNLANYDSRTEEIRLDFNYILHGQNSKPTGNNVWVRGSDTAKWQRLYTYDADVAQIGRVQHSGSLSLTDALGMWRQDFTPSTQVMFEQNDVSVIGGKGSGRGLTLDDLRIYTVENDFQLLSIVSPAPISCGLPNPAPLTVKIRNGVSQELFDVQISYRLDSGEVVTEIIPSIKGKQTINYTFNTYMDIPDPKLYTIDVWGTVGGDTYAGNDSLFGYTFRNQHKIDQYPYFEDFEAGPGSWYPAGVNASWEYGTPASEKINTAASGTKAWKTNLDGKYNNSERAYLNGPCFDLSQMEDPVLRFKLAYDIEFCGIVYCDAAYMEYSVDGTNWSRLGKWDDGINWYNDTGYNIWSMEDNVAWHEASLSLKDSIGTIRLRYVFTSDPAGNYDGIAIDDIEVYDRKFEVPEQQLLHVSPNPNSDGRFTIAWTAYAGTQMQIAITEMTGRQVYSTSLQAEGEHNETRLQTPMFMSGVYFMQIRIGDQRYVRKIVFRRN